MLLRPRRLPRRYNRQVSEYTRSLLKERRRTQRSYTWERWKRLWQRVKRRTGQLREHAMRALVFGLIGLIPVMIIVVAFSPVLRLQKISVDRSEPRVNVERVVRSLSSLFGKRLFFLSAQDVSPFLEKDIPDLAGVDVRKVYPDTLRLRLTFDPIVARLEVLEPGQQGDVSGSGAVTGNYLTSEGVYVTYAPAQVGSGVLLPIVRLTDWGVRPAPGTVPYDPKILTELPAAEKALREQFGQPVIERVVYVRAREYHLRVKEFTLWLDLRSPLEEQLQRYRLFLQSPGKGAATVYVDLRLSDRVVYK